MKTLAEVLAFASDAHGEQKYGDHPYTHHLQAVSQVLFDVGYHEFEYHAAALLHDVIEDTPVTAEVLADIGLAPNVVEAVLFCTDEPGVTRLERKLATYSRIEATSRHPIGVVVKWADRVANVKMGGSMLKRYQKESPGFVQAYMPDGAILQDQRFQALLALYQTHTQLESGK